MTMAVTEIESLRAAIERTWESIYPDVDHRYMENNACRIEMVLDSDRLLYAGHAEQHRQFRNYCNQYGYDTVFDQLVQHIQLAK